TRILFDMYAVQRNTPIPFGRRDWNLTALANGSAILCQLISFRQIGIEVILAIENIKPADLAATCEPHANCILSNFAVQLWQCSRMPECDHTHICIWITAK